MQDRPADALPAASLTGAQAPEPPRPLAGNAAWRLAAVLVRVAVGFLSVPWFTRILGMSQWGLLALFQAATVPLGLLEGFGFATVKHASEALGRRDREAATAAVQTTVVVNLALSCAGMIGLAVAARWLATSVFAIPPGDVERAVDGFRLIGVTWALALATAPYTAVLAAHQRYDALARLGVAAFVGSTAAGLVAARLTHGIVPVVAAQTVAAAVMAVVYFRRAARLLPGINARPRIHAPSLQRAGRFWRWQLLAAVGSLASTWGDRYILGASFPPAVVGFYAVANMPLTQLYLAFYEMGEVLFPAVSALEGRGELPAARRLSLIVGWALTTGFGVCAAVLASVGGDFLHLWISPEAAQATTDMLRVLCLSGLAGIAAIAPLQYVFGVGETRGNAYSSLVSAVLVLGLGIALVPRFGLTGIGYGLLAAALARWVYVLIIWKEHFSRDVPFRRFATHVFSPPLLSAAVLFAAVRCHDALGHAPSWPWLAVEAIVAFAAVATLQLGASELFPGGRQRRRDVVASLAPVVTQILRKLRGH